MTSLPVCMHYRKALQLNNIG